MVRFVRSLCPTAVALAKLIRATAFGPVSGCAMAFLPFRKSKWPKHRLLRPLFSRLGGRLSLGTRRKAKRLWILRHYAIYVNAHALPKSLGGPNRSVIADLRTIAVSRGDSSAWWRMARRRAGNQIGR